MKNEIKFPAILHPDENEGGNSGFVVTFPDVPEAITQGETKEEAVLMAKEALELALDFYLESGRPLPTPSELKLGQYEISLML